jgi:hypothetical protein
VIEPPEGPLPDGVYLADDLLDAGSADLDALAAATQPDDLATLIYTSGTTGPPKGVMISQYNIVYTIEILKRSIHFDNFVGMRVVSYLPMAHIAERSGQPLPVDDARLQRLLLPRPQPAHHLPQGGAPATRLRRAARVGEDLQRGQRRTLRGPRPQGAVRRRHQRRHRDPALEHRRELHRRTAGHPRLPRQRGVRQRASARRARRRRTRHHRRRPHSRAGARVVHRDRRADRRDLRHVGDHGSDDLLTRAPQDRHRRAGRATAWRW